MSPSEEEQFSIRLSKDQDFQESFELHKAIVEVISDKKQAEIRNILNEIKSENRKRKGLRKRNVFKLSAVAACIAAISVLFFENRRKEYTNTEIFNTYFDSIPICLTTRGEQEKIINTFDSGLFYLEKRNYNKAISELQKTADSSELYPASQFFTALSYMAMKDFKNAIPILRQISENSICLFYEDAIWNLALCYIMIGDKEKAKKRLEELKTMTSCYSGKAEEIIEIID